MSSPARRALAAIFDLDGVLTDTAELHYLSWQTLADELGIPFDRMRNDELRGLSRERSLELVLADRARGFTESQKAELTRRKNDDYLRRVAAMTPRDVLPGARELLSELRERSIPVALASSSRNARVVLERLELAELLAHIVDGNDATRSKPDPQVFTMAAERLAIHPSHCVVVEDAASGIEAALSAGMRVLGVGPAERVARAHFRVISLVGVSAEKLLAI